MMKTSHFLCTLLLTLSLNALGHGENTLGPHGGAIQMPGVFHTELVITGGNQFKLYLLDINFQAAISQASTIHAQFIGDKTFNAHCQRTQNYFSCQFEQAVFHRSGQLQIQAKLDKNREGTATYSIPLVAQ